MNNRTEELYDKYIEEKYGRQPINAPLAYCDMNSKKYYTPYVGLTSEYETRMPRPLSIHNSVDPKYEAIKRNYRFNCVFEDY